MILQLVTRQTSIKRLTFAGALTCAICCARVLLLLVLCAATATAALQEQTLSWGGTERHYLIGLPPGYSARNSCPLLLVFHGGGGNPGQVLKSSDIRERAEREGWILVAPAGSGRMGNLLTWNVGFGFGYALTAKVDDVGFVRRLLDELQATYRIDPDRIYATGISNGGILCHQLAGALSDRIAAIAPIVAAAGGRLQGAADWIRPAPPRHPVAVVAFNGALDLSIPLSGGLQQRSWAEPVEVWSARESVDFWVRANGCRPEPEVERNTAARFERWRFTGGKGEGEVVQYVLLDQGHAWPGGERGYRRGDEPTRLVSANALMIEFFRQHPKTR